MVNIISQILQTTSGGNDTKTRMHNAFPNYAQLIEYLRVLTEGDLLGIDQLMQTFKRNTVKDCFTRSYIPLVDGDYCIADYY